MIIGLSSHLVPPEAGWVQRVVPGFGFSQGRGCPGFGGNFSDQRPLRPDRSAGCSAAVVWPCRRQERNPGAAVGCKRHSARQCPGLVRVRDSQQPRAHAGLLSSGPPGRAQETEMRSRKHVFLNPDAAFAPRRPEGVCPGPPAGHGDNRSISHPAPDRRV